MVVAVAMVVVLDVTVTVVVVVSVAVVIAIVLVFPAADMTRIIPGIGTNKLIMNSDRFASYYFISL